MGKQTCDPPAHHLTWCVGKLGPEAVKAMRRLSCARLVAGNEGATDDDQRDEVTAQPALRAAVRLPGGLRSVEESGKEGADKRGSCAGQGSILKTPFQPQALKPLPLLPP
jgi:hypothetical protein